MSSEYIVAQKPIINYCKKIGWTYKSREELEKLRLLNENKTFGFILKDNLKRKLIQFNPNLEDVDQIIDNLEKVSDGIYGNKLFLEYLKNKKNFFSKKLNRELNLKVIDYEDINNNDFIVTDEFYAKNHFNAIRQDVVFIINGLPIIDCETKNATKEDAIEESIKQIDRYHNEVPELLTLQQMFVASDAMDFNYGSTWNLSRRGIFKWKSDKPGKLNIKAETFFDKKNILNFVKKYITFSEKEKKLTKFILMHHQIEALELCIDRALDKTKKRALIWHTQGSGKTLTMMSLAQNIFERTKDKPTILMLIDRTELEDKLITDLISIDLNYVKVAKSIADISNLLKEDFRGIIVSTIQKFEKIKKDINLKNDIYVLVDEAHRTTQGDLGNYLMGAIPNATFFGFTGTPIDKTLYGKGTFKTFGTDDDKGFLHKYSILDSLKDKTTLPLFYGSGPNDLKVPTDILEKQFLELSELEGVNDTEELDKVLSKSTNLKEFLKGEKRIEKISKFIANHFLKNIEPLGFKAFVVAVDREACVTYKKYLDQFMSPNLSEVIISKTNDDNLDLKKFHFDDNKQKKILKDFIENEEKPKILIVTSKLLTGFDAPILYGMYLDKPMKDHTLLQAIARVNRPLRRDTDEKIEKTNGFILDFVGIFSNVKKALAFDSEDVESVIHNIDILKENFKQKLEKIVKEINDNVTNISKQINDTILDNIIVYFSDKKKRELFLENFKEVQNLYEIISPDPFLSDFLNQYRKILEIFLVVKKAYTKKVYTDKNLLEKTKKLYQENIDIENLRGGEDIIELNEDTVKEIIDKNKPKEVKIVNLIKSIRNKIKKSKDFGTISLSEKAEKIIEKYDERQRTTEEVLNELINLINKSFEDKSNQKKSGLDVETYFYYKFLEENDIDDPKNKSQTLKKLFDSNYNWKKDQNLERKLRQEIYLIIDEKLENIEKLKLIVDKLILILKK